MPASWARRRTSWVRKRASRRQRGRARARASRDRPSHIDGVVCGSLRFAGADEALHGLLAQLERRARSAAAQDLARLLIDDGQERVWIVLVQLDVEIGAQPLTGLARTR